MSLFPVFFSSALLFLSVFSASSAVYAWEDNSLACTKSYLECNDKNWAERTRARNQCQMSFRPGTQDQELKACMADLKPRWEQRELVCRAEQKSCLGSQKPEIHSLFSPAKFCSGMLKTCNRGAKSLAQERLALCKDLSPMSSCRIGADQQHTSERKYCIATFHQCTGELTNFDSKAKDPSVISRVKELMRQKLLKKKLLKPDEVLDNGGGGVRG